MEMMATQEGRNLQVPSVCQALCYMFYEPLVLTIENRLLSHSMDVEAEA